MIISISGKLGSGKDSVGKIVQYLTAKDVSVGCLSRLSDGLPIEGYHNSSFEIKKFAGKLKTIASLLTGIPVEKFEDQEFKKTDLPSEWCYIENGYSTKNMTYRQLLQRVGTDSMRNGLHEDVWCNALYSDYTPRKNWVLTDTRFPNEFTSVTDRGGINIRVNRDNGMIDLEPHSSETALDNYEFDYTIDNSGTLNELIEKVRVILVKEKIV